MLKYRIDSKAVEAAFRRAPEAVASELGKGTKRGLVIIQREARATHEWDTITGAAERSVQTKAPDPAKGGEVFLDKGIAKHSIFLHEGTGIFGPKKRPIKPTRKKNLHFFSQSHGWVKTKSVKGIKGDKFLEKAGEKKREEVIREITKGLSAGLVKAGLK